MLESNSFFPVYWAGWLIFYQSVSREWKINNYWGKKQGKKSKFYLKVGKVERAVINVFYEAIDMTRFQIRILKNQSEFTKLHFSISAVWCSKKEVPFFRTSHGLFLRKLITLLLEQALR